MIRSTQISLKFANSGKIEYLNDFLKEYNRIFQLIVDKLWEKQESPKYVKKNITDQISTWLSARVIQCVSKQASAVVRGTLKKNKCRIWMRNKLFKEGKDTTILDKIINRTVLSKPKINNCPAELDSRFIKINFEKTTSFDGWITILSTGGPKIVIPFKRHKHFNKLYEIGKIKKGARVGKDIKLMFELPSLPLKIGETVGVDIGITNCITTSNGFVSQVDKDGHTLTSILKKVARRKRGSVGFRQATTHRKNFINWTINQLNLNTVKEIKREDIKNLYQNQHLSRFMSHWTYRDIFGKLDRFCEEQGVLVTKVNPAYTSQTCSVCHTKGRRIGKLFLCSCCGERDADLNAALNIRESIVPCLNVFL